MEAISYRQTVFLLSMITPVTGHFLLLPTIFFFAGHEAWVTILLAMPLGLFFGFVLYRLHYMYPTHTFSTMLEQSFGLILGKVLGAGLIGYFLYLTFITFYGLLDFVQVIFLPEAPKWAIAIGFYLVVFYALHVGVESITRISEALLPIIIFTGSSIGIATMGEKDYELLFPVFENGLFPLTDGIILTAALYGEMTLLLMLHLKKDYDKSKSLLFTNTVLVVLITIMFSGTVTGTLAVFGEEFVKTLEYPAQSIVRLVSFGFIERFDIYGIAVLVFGSVIRVSVLQISLYEGIRHWFGLGSTKWRIHLAITILIVTLSFLGIDSHRHYMSTYITHYYSLTVIISVGLPLFTWVVSETKRMMNKIN